MAVDFLCDIIMAEVNALGGSIQRVAHAVNLGSGLDNDHLMFRGNTLATKAMEAYMKLVAADYLHSTLGDYIKHVLDSGENCEVDPLKLSSPSNAMLEKNRQNLTMHVETAWGKIINTSHSFPQQLRHVFDALRRRLEQNGRGELADNLISSSIFLRFLCPAILSPSLFNLVSLRA